jgi:hypothetical protein
MPFSITQMLDLLFLCSRSRDVEASCYALIFCQDMMALSLEMDEFNILQLAH